MCDLEGIGDPSIFNTIRSVSDLVRILPTLDLRCEETGLRVIQLLLYIDSVEEVVIVCEVELQKPRNLSASESEEHGHGEGVGVYATLLQSDTL